MGKVATSPLPYRWIPTASERGAKSEVAHKWAKWLPHACRIGGSPPLQSGGQNRKWPTSGQSGYLTPAVSGIPTTSKRGAKLEVAHKWAKWLPHPCRIGGSPPLQSGGQSQKWPTSGQSGCLTAVSGIPTASERGAKSEVAHKWAKWLPHPCRIGGSPTHQSGGQSQKWPTSGQSGYLTPAVSGDPHRFRAGGKVRSGPQVGNVATSPLPYWGIPTASERAAKSEVAHKWAKWLPHPCRIGDPHRFRAGGKVRSGPQVGKGATSPLPYRGSPPLQSGGQNEKWPTSGQSGCLTPAVSGIPTASERGGKVRSGPQVGKVATSPLPYRRIPTASERGAKSEVADKWGKWLPHPCRIGGSPPLHSGGQNQKWPTSGQSGYLTPAVSGIPSASERGAKSEVAHKWAKWLPHPCRIGGSPPLQCGGQNRKWPTNGQSGYLTPAVSGIPTASKRGAKLEVAHKWAKWLPHPCRIGGSPPLQSVGQSQKWPTSGQSGYLTPAVSGDPHRIRAGGKVRSGPQVGKVATSPLPYRGIPTASERGAKSEVAHKWAMWLPHPCRIGGSPPLQSGRQNQKWPTSGQSGYLTPAVSGIPTASERGAKSEVAHKWAKGLPHPCRIGDPHRFRAGGKMRSGPQVGKVAASPLPYRGSPPLQSGGAKSEVAHKWAKWLPHPCRIGGSPPLQSGGQNQKWPTSGESGYLTPAVLGDPHRFIAGGKIRSGPQVGKVATSPLPYRGSPPLPSGGQSQKWPTSGQSGYLTPAVSGDPHRFRAGGKIGNGPQMGKVATSPLPYRGSPPLQSGGQS